MKNKVLILASVFFVLCFFNVEANNQNLNLSKSLSSQDESFNGNYMAKFKKVCMYSKADSTSKTKIKMSDNILLIVTKKSGEFVYGEFSVSSDKSYSGWFRLKDLTEVKMVAPVISN